MVSLSRPQAASKSVTGDVQRIAGLLRLNSCDPERSEIKFTLGNASASVGNPSISCTMWTLAESPITIFSSSVDIAGIRLPVVVYFNRSYIDSAADSLVIEVVGGPGGDISPGANDTLPFALARSGVVVVRLGYTGTSHGTLYPRPNFDLAARQVLEYSKAVRAENPSGKLVLLGESLGGPIVAHAAASSNPPPFDGLALVLPMLFTPDEAIRNFGRIVDSSRPGAGDKTVRTIAGSPDSWRDGQRVRVPSTDLYDRFFPPESRGRDLASYLERVRSTKILIAYGDSDKVVGLSKLDDPSLNTRNIRKLRLRGIPHMMNSSSASQVSDEILVYLL